MKHTNGLPLFANPRFDGETYEPPLDQSRLGGQLERVYAAMQDGAWWTLAALASAVGGSEAGVSARIRDLRKSRFGSHRVARRRLAGGLWQYQLRRRGDHS